MISAPKIVKNIIRYNLRERNALPYIDVCSNFKSWRLCV
jgi:hypothetical protein